MTPRPITVQQLRELAETASGGRDKPQGIKYNQQNGEWDCVARDANDTSGFDIVLDPMPGQDRKKLSVILPQVKKPAVSDWGPVADAVFWSPSAVQKFVLPYYASFKSTDYLEKKVVAEILDNDTLAIIHLPDSETIEGEGLLDSSANGKVRRYSLYAAKAPPNALVKNLTLKGIL